ncbi:MAG: hypothetical protein KDA88_09970 [Planctomycetaceae bacterium]|nr:hypothetical protein [Planctomycetaceae bacterium]MCB9953936.1 hypothetical protein [Planctomycetaceae bacterium]
MTAPATPEPLPDPPLIQYRNTDLDLVCDVDPSPLVTEFDADDLYVHVQAGDDGLFYVMCEGGNESEPELNIVRLLAAIDTLSPAGREVWQRCSKREFNIGYGCGDEPWSFNQGLSNDVLRRMADCGTTFRITLYPHRPESDRQS